MTTTTVRVPIHSGFRGFVAGVSVLSILLISLCSQLPVSMIDDSCSQVVDADFKQRAHFELYIDGGLGPVSSATMEAQGQRVNLKDVANQREHWSFGPISSSGYILVKITHFDGPREKDSKMVGPLSVSRSPFTVGFGARRI
jgi:hypothetical protein